MRSQCCLTSASLYGVEAKPVTVEVAVGSGLPGMSIVGMADTAVQEAKERVKSAIKASSFSMPAEKIVVNLAPGDLRKTGSGFDLPIALGILAATGQVDRRLLEGRLFVGELSLDGKVRQVAGDLACCICASRIGCGYVAASRRRAPLEGIEQLALSHLARLHAEDALEDLSEAGCASRAPEPEGRLSRPDFRDVSGHEVAKRALQIAAAGGHRLLMVGPPGSGKTMLAERIPSILPRLSQDEMLEAAAVHSVAGVGVEDILDGNRPYRSPHHSSTAAGLLGGGNPIRPGEVSLAHMGVLFLDELAEFNPSVLQGLRQPIEEGAISLTRAMGRVRMPARFMLVAATNPCPCGYYGDDGHECTCTSGQIRKYQAKIGGPLIDRFEMQLDVRRIPSCEVLASGEGTSSEALRDGVLKAREFSSWRKAGSCDAKGPARVGGSDFCTGGRGVDGGGRTTGMQSLGKASTRKIVESCMLCDEAQRFAISLSDMHDMSARALVGSLNVARTIADMEEAEMVKVEHLAEAFGFRLSEYIGG